MRRAYIIPFGVNTTCMGKTQIVFFLQRKDHHLSNVWGELKFEDDYCNKIMAVGGGVEQGEDDHKAAMRDLQEEVPGWYDQARIPAAKVFCGVNSLISYSESFETQIFFKPVDVGMVSTRLYCSLTKEGVPAVMTLQNIKASPPSEWVKEVFRNSCLSIGDTVSRHLAIG